MIGRYKGKESLIVIAMFFGAISTFYFGSKTLIDIDKVSAFWLLLGGAIYITHLPFFELNKLNLIFIGIISFLSYGLLITGLSLTINYFVSNNTVTRIIPIQLIGYEGDGNEPSLKFKTSDTLFENQDYVLQFELDTVAESYSSARVIISNGCLGYKVVKSSVLIPDVKH
jgi:hypothetical protein